MWSYYTTYTSFSHSNAPTQNPALENSVKDNKFKIPIANIHPRNKMSPIKKTFPEPSSLTSPLWRLLNNEEKKDTRYVKISAARIKGRRRRMGPSGTYGPKEPSSSHFFFPIDSTFILGSRARRGSQSAFCDRATNPTLHEDKNFRESKNFRLKMC